MINRRNYNSSLKFDGVSGEAYRGDAEIALGQFFILQERLSLLDMTNYYDIDGYCMIVKRPDSALTYDAIVLPFTTIVWILTLMVMLLLAIFIAIWLTLLPDAFVSPSNGVFHLTGIVFGQHWSKEPRQVLYLPNSSSMLI